MIYCANCEHGCSPVATTCPACGHPLQEPVKSAMDRAYQTNLKTGPLGTALLAILGVAIAAAAIAHRTDSPTAMLIATLAGYGFVAMLYVLPVLVAYQTRHPHRKAIFAVTIALLLTVPIALPIGGIGWLAVLAWSFVPPRAAA